MTIVEKRHRDEVNSFEVCRPCRPCKPQACRTCNSTPLDSPPFHTDAHAHAFAAHTASANAPSTPATAAHPALAPAHAYSAPDAATATVLDHALFPHILDAILSFASQSSLLLIRQTCRDLRGRVHPRLFEHVLFLPCQQRIDIRTASAPHLLLGTLDMRTSSPSPSSIPPELANTRVLDVHAIPPHWDLCDLPMERLTTIRRIHSDRERDRHRYFRHLPPAGAIIERVDLTAGAMPLPRASIAAPYGTKHHIVHLHFDERAACLPALKLSMYGKCQRRTIVLHPYGHTRSLHQAGDRCRQAETAAETTSEASSGSTAGSAQTDAVPPTPAQPQPHFTVLADLLRRARAGRGHGNRTPVVGLERLLPSTLGEEFLHKRSWDSGSGSKSHSSCDERGACPSYLGAAAPSSGCDEAPSPGPAIVDEEDDDNDDHSSARTRKWDPLELSYDAWVASFARDAPETFGSYFQSETRVARWGGGGGGGG